MARNRREKERNYKIEYEVQGNIVRKLEPERRQYEDELDAPRVSKRARKNREKALAMNMGYVLFLAAACAAVLFFCVRYISLQAEVSGRTKNIAALEAQLNELKAVNDEEYNRIMSSVDLDYVKDVALNELGMVYAGEDQVIIYEKEESDYTRQYKDIE